MLEYYEFFAGGGMVRAGLGAGWSCLFANDFDHKKSRTYRDNWGEGAALKTADVHSLKTTDLPGQAALVWASFPCQDLSLAGGGAGLKGERSGTFWPFWNLVRACAKEGRAAPVIVLENVCGTLTSHGGKDFTAICEAFRQTGYRCGAVVIDAALFVPQSRPRLFVIGVRDDLALPPGLAAADPASLWHSRALVNAYDRLLPRARQNWVWWAIPKPARRKTSFDDLIEANPASVPWHTKQETTQLLAMMSRVNRAKVEQAKRAGRQMVGTIYKRTRHDENGIKVQRAEIRFDDVAGCLRTPAGGSSRQLIMVVDGRTVRSRLISSRETARLMGLPDDYRLPENYNEAYHLTGDGVVVPVVRHLASHVIEPILRHQERATREAA
ncbi:MAG: DNA cytosine methyltransferase [Hyphomicrobiales bacterium]|nr:DNA cytosine methyltransferase [Hyphomicrobiales bacterium]